MFVLYFLKRIEMIPCNGCFRSHLEDYMLRDWIPHFMGRTPIHTAVEICLGRCGINVVFHSPPLFFLPLLW